MILTGDAITMLRTLEPESVQCCVTSPPYWGLRDYGVDGQLGLERAPDEYVANLTRCLNPSHRHDCRRNHRDRTDRACPSNTRDDDNLVGNNKDGAKGCRALNAGNRKNLIRLDEDRTGLTRGLNTCNRDNGCCSDRDGASLACTFNACKRDIGFGNDSDRAGLACG